MNERRSPPSPQAGAESRPLLVENIVKRYGDFEAVKGVSFEVAEGEIFGCSVRTAPARAPSFA